MNGDVTKSSGCNLNNKLNGKKRINNGCFFCFGCTPKHQFVTKEMIRSFIPLGGWEKHQLSRWGKATSGN